MISESSPLRLVVWRGYDDREAAAPLLAERGLSLDVTYVDADEDAIRLLHEAGPGWFDLVAIDNRYLPLMVEDDLLVPLDRGRLHHLDDVFETFARLGRGDDGTTWSAPYIWGRHPMPYNAAYVAEPPSSWLDVLRPELRGRVAMLDGCVHQLVTWGRVLGYRDPVRIGHAELAAAVGLAVRVKRETQAHLVGWDEILTLLATGQAWVATAGWEAISRFAAELGADVRLSYPKEEVYPWMDSWCLVRGAPSEDAAYAWIDWMIGPEAQRVICRNLPCGTVNRRAVELLDGEVRTLFPHEELEALVAAYHVEMPPREAKHGMTTLADWHEAWEEVRAA